MEVTSNVLREQIRKLQKTIVCADGSGLTLMPYFNNGTLTGYVAYTADSEGTVIQHYFDDTGQPTTTAPTGSLQKTVDNRHAEVVDTGTITLTDVSNYSYSVISGSATVTINGVTLSGVPTGFDARQGESTPDQLLNDITITGESGGTRVIIYYEL